MTNSSSNQTLTHSSLFFLNHILKLWCKPGAPETCNFHKEFHKTYCIHIIFGQMPSWQICALKSSVMLHWLASWVLLPFWNKSVSLSSMLHTVWLCNTVRTQLCVVVIIRQKLIRFITVMKTNHISTFVLYKKMPCYLLLT